MILENFYPRSPCGERHTYPGALTATTKFLSTLSLRRATYDTYSLMQCQAIFLSTLSLRRATGPGPARLASGAYFYPRSPCGERLGLDVTIIGRTWISIHALLAESDTWARGSRVTYVISIHALLAESDALTELNACCRRGFLSTLSLRRATCGNAGIGSPISDFYPRSPCGERHADTKSTSFHKLFLSTLSLRRATR